jgi:hypothetical protein
MTPDIERVRGAAQVSRRHGKRITLGPIPDVTVAR